MWWWWSHSTRRRARTEADTMGVMKPIVALVCFSSLLAGAAESLNVFGHTWTITTPAADWSVGDNLLQLKTSSEPIPGQPRRPTHFALLDSKPYSKVTVEGEFKRNGRSLIIVYAYQNESHFKYAHMSSDNAVKQNVHNGIFPCVWRRAGPDFVARRAGVVYDAGLDAGE